MPTQLLIVIPSRNRSELAAAAIRSVLSQAHPQATLWVSDNSTDPLEVERLGSFCAAAGAALRYLRPPEPLAMGKHWEWVLRQALEAGQFSHCCVLTDRMVFLPGAIKILIKLCGQLQQAIVSYPADLIKDDRSPVALIQESWTGRVLRIQSADFIQHQLHKGWVEPLPRLLNCIAPCSALRSNLDRYGAICESISPDIAFGFRQLALIKEFYWLDRPLLVQYGLTQSNGLSILQSDQRNAFASDFLSNLDNRGLNYAAPIPGLPTLYSAVYHEYNLVRNAHGDHFPRINLAAYRRQEHARIRKYADATYKSAIMDALRKFTERELARIVLDTPKFLLEKAARNARPRPLFSRIKLKLIARPVRRRRITEYADVGTAIAMSFSQPLPHRRGPAKIESEMPTSLALKITA